MVIAPDLRGFGDSDAPQGKKHYTFDIITSDVIALLDHLGVRKVSVVGHDLGAVVGWLLAVRYPERLNTILMAYLGQAVPEP